MRRTLLTLTTIVALLVGVLPAAAQRADDAAQRENPAAPYAPLDRPGPRLSVDPAALEQSLSCTASVAPGITVDPVLLLPGTTMQPEENFSWNWMQALDDAGRPWCAVTLPARANGDIQVAAEHVVHALRTISRMTAPPERPGGPVGRRPGLGRPVDVLGHSQGGMITRWALRFWPDTRPLVDDLIGMAPSNHGTDVANANCHTPCPAAFRQQMTGSQFIDALNSGAETFAGIDYTSIWSQFDEIIVPQSGSELHTGDGDIANVMVQSICPGHPVEHLGIGTFDAVAHAVAWDALTNDGPADPLRIDPAVCSAGVMPGVNPLTFPTDFGATAVRLSVSIAEAEKVSQEPVLADYVFD